MWLPRYQSYQKKKNSIFLHLHAWKLIFSDPHYLNLFNVSFDSAIKFLVSSIVYMLIYIPYIDQKPMHPVILKNVDQKQRLDQNITPAKFSSLVSNLLTTELFPFQNRLKSNNNYSGEKSYIS